jgi:hypothetical protein
LAILGYYGGATPTLALLECSPALDAGDSMASPVTDQRGKPRPAGAGVDIGAFEGSVPGCLRITTPLIDQEVLVGSGARLTVAAEGTPPLSYQWQFNGINMLNQTNLQLKLTSAQTNESGYYAVLVSNAAGLSIGGARLTVSDGKSPTITTQPQSQNVYRGESVTLSVTASGYPTPQYQWRFNDANLASATNSNLSQASITTNQAGIYSVVVSNMIGVVVSSNAVLTVSTESRRLAIIPNSIAWSQDQLRFTVQGEAGRALEVQTSTNLSVVNWTTLATLTNLTGTLPFNDPNANAIRRYYRLRQVP